MPFTCSDIFKLLLAILLPPLGVFLEVGLGRDFWINILLTILGYIPGKWLRWLRRALVRLEVPTLILSRSPGIIHAVVIIFHF